MQALVERGCGLDVHQATVVAGTPMAVFTNKPAKLSVELLEGLGLARFFRRVY
jgi:phosphoglycolate phosphatase-like HAD superfamily hydrolase